MTENMKYIPVLKWKQAEWGALKNLDDNIKSQIIPFVEPILKADSEDESIKLLKKKKRRITIPSKIVMDNWGLRELFIDGYLLSFDTINIDKYRIIEEILNNHKNPNNVILVTGFGRDEQYNKIIKSHLQKNGKIGLRISKKELNTDLTNKIGTFQKLFGVKKTEISLFVDLGYIENDLISFSEIESFIPDIHEWKTYSIIAGSQPSNLMKIKPGIHKIKRIEWDVFRREIKKPITRKPIYGDYVTVHPINLQTKGFDCSASIKYTVEDYCIIVRGKSIKHYKHQQYFGNAQMLSKQIEYCGESYCFGDNYIMQTWKERLHSGTPGTWIKAAINHHITFMIKNNGSNILS